MLPTKGAHAPADDSVALAIVALARRSASRTSASPPAAAPVSVPEGRPRRQTDPRTAATTRPRTAATPPTAARSSCPRTGPTRSSRLIALPVTRIHARSAHPAEPIFRLEGGPGITNMQFAKASRFAADHDVVLVGYRGVDGSVRLDCPEVESALKHSTDFLGEKSFRAYGDAFRACADRLTGDGVDLAGYTLPQRVDDLEAARKALGYDRIDLSARAPGRARR